MNPSIISSSFRDVSFPGYSAAEANPAHRAVLTKQGTLPVLPAPQYSPVPPVCSFHRSLVSRDKAALPLPSGRNSATGRYLEAQQKKRTDGAWNLFGLMMNNKDDELQGKGTRILTIPISSSISFNNKNPAFPPKILQIPPVRWDLLTGMKVQGIHLGRKTISKE